MKVRITAKRWDQAVELEAEEITFRHVAGNTVQIVLDGEPPYPVELSPEFGECIEVVA